jgi:hypothetical protein
LWICGLLGEGRMGEVRGRTSCARSKGAGGCDGAWGVGCDIFAERSDVACSGIGGVEDVMVIACRCAQSQFCANSMCSDAVC